MKNILLKANYRKVTGKDEKGNNIISEFKIGTKVKMEDAEAQRLIDMNKAEKAELINETKNVETVPETKMPEEKK